MFSSSYIYVGICTAILCYFAYKYFYKFVNKITHHIEYVRKGDPDAQANYDALFQDPNALGKDEKVELSWQFLYDITDYVLSKFSKEDKETATQLGIKLLKFGANYEHVIEYGIKSLKKRIGIDTEIDASQQKDTGITI